MLTDDDSAFSISRLAQLFGVARDTVSKRIGLNGAKPAGKKAGYPVYQLKDVAELKSAGNAEPSMLLPDNMEPKERRDWYASENDRLKFEKEEGGLVDKEAVRSEFATLGRALAETVQSFPDRMERDYGATPKEVERLVSLCDSLQSVIVEKFAE